MSCVPPDDRPMLLRHSGWNSACHLFEHCDFAIAINKLDGNIEIQQTLKCFMRHWARKHIASDHNMLYSYPTNLFEHGLQGREVPMNVV